MLSEKKNHHNQVQNKTLGVDRKIHNIIKLCDIVISLIVSLFYHYVELILSTIVT